MHKCMIRIREMNNPFQYGRELGIEELVDRHDELNQITTPRFSRS